MYTGGVGCCLGEATPTGAPAAPRERPQSSEYQDDASAVWDWLFGHSDQYDATVNAIPHFGQLARQGDACAYVVLRAWAGEQLFCRYAIDRCHEYYLGTSIGQPGPCGAAGSVKDDARREAEAVLRARPDVAAMGLALVMAFNAAGAPPAPVSDEPLLAGSVGGVAVSTLLIGGLITAGVVAVARRL